jgi:hypothetical protein
MKRRLGVAMLMIGSAAMLQPVSALAQNADQASKPVAKSAATKADKHHKHKKQNDNPGVTAYVAPANYGGFGSGYQVAYTDGYQAYGNSGGYFDAYGMWHVYAK